ncbi:MAG: ABC transporter ATP-binding protein [Alphaproteobacteria bacterium]|nr:ABC transporter ATP-binding protein [Alphaproteobacteria bacterium]
MDKSVFAYIWRHSKAEQIVILGLVLVSQFLYFISLTIPKTIVNDGIEGKAFKKAPEIPFLKFDLPLPGWLFDQGSLRLFDGFMLAQWPYLVAMSLLFLTMVTVNGLFKMQINTLKGRMGERMLRRLRFELYDRMLRFPLPHFRKVKAAEMAGMVNNEVEPLGGFISEAFIQPAYLGGQALTALLFIMLQSLAMGVIVIVVLAVQAFVIPQLRKRILVLSKQRQLQTRALSGRIAETVDGSQEIHLNATSNYERADIGRRLGQIFVVRFELFKRKFLAKFLNNLLSQTTPFTIFLIGGYGVLFGDMQIGSVVGVLLAYKDLPGPVKELIDWDQHRTEVQQKYEQVIEQFAPEGMMDPTLQALPEGPVPALAGDLETVGLTLADEGGAKPLDALALSLPLGTKLALVGPATGGRDVLAQVLARILPPTAGSAKIGGSDLLALPESTVGARLAYVGPDVYLFPLSIRDNLLYALKRRPMTKARYAEAALAQHEAERAETRRAGNPDLDPTDDWIDREAAGAVDNAGLTARLVAMLKVVELEEDVYTLGLRGTIDPKVKPDVAAAILGARNALHETLADPSLASLVEPFDASRYNRNMSLAGNLLFGTPVGNVFNPDNLGRHPLVLAALRQAGLEAGILAMGVKIAETMVELFADLAPDNPFFEQYSFISAEDLPEYRGLLQRLAGRDPSQLGEDEQARFTALPFRYVEARHRLGLIDAAMEERVLAARRAFAEALPLELRGAVAFYDHAAYNSAATLQDNILFGRPVYGQARSAERVGQLINEVLDGLGLRSRVIEVGLDYNVGIAGKRLAPAQRQKIGLARALIKRSDLLILNEPTSALDAAAQVRIRDKVLAAAEGRGVIWSLGRPALADAFEQVALLQGGKLTARGTPAEIAANPLYAEFAAAN